MSISEPTTLSSVEFAALVEVLRNSGDQEDDARLTCGEASALVTHHRGDLVRAAKDSGRRYKTLAERRRVILFYQEICPADIEIGASAARDLLAEFPTLGWKHLVLAKSLKKPQWSYKALIRRGIHMTVDEFGLHLARIKARLGKQKFQRKYIIDNGRGLRIIIERY